MSTAPGPTSRTPLLAAHNARQASQAAESSSSTRPSRSLSPIPSYTRPSAVPSASFIRRRKRKRSPKFQVVPAIITVALLALVTFMAWDVSSYGNCYFRALCRVLGDEDRLDQVWWENAGAYAPWRSVGPGGGKRGLPRGCEINQVTVFHRHGARYPTASGGQCIQGVLDKIANRSIEVPRRHSELAFIAKADLKMTGWKFDTLLNQGRKAAWRSGREMVGLYQNLVKTGQGLFVRSSGGDRVVETASYWIEGFAEQAFKLRPVEQLPRPNVTIPEGETSNNTLSVHTCPAFDDQPSKDLSGLLDQLAPARDRLNRVLGPRPALTTDDLICLADMCPYDSQAEGTEWAGWSRWCGIFTKDEWDIIGHWRDTSRYYDVGQGSPYGSTMGAGWVNELIARLTDSVPEDATTTNRTLDLNESTFPRGGRRVFVDFGHDNEIIEIITAMGILKQQRRLSTKKLPDKRTYLTPEIIPFGARVVFERIGCHLGDWEPDPEAPPGQDGDGRKNYVRIFVNDALVSQEHIACQQSGFVEHLMCEVESFVESQYWSQNQVDFGVCSSS